MDESLVSPANSFHTSAAWLVGVPHWKGLGELISSGVEQVLRPP